MGWIHILKGADERPFVRPPAPSIPKSVKHTNPNIPQINRASQDAMTDALWIELSGILGLEIESLKPLQCGFYFPWGCFTFPMQDGIGNVIGIRTRHRRTGEKRAITGSHNGLFVPEPQDLSLGDFWCLPEGPSSCAAALQLGFCAIGRPNNRVGPELVIQLLKRFDGRRRVTVVVLCDDDVAKTLPNGDIMHAGQDGGLAFAKELVPHCREVKCLVTPRPSFKPLPGYSGKDLRDSVIFVGSSGLPGLRERMRFAIRATPALSRN